MAASKKSRVDKKIEVFRRGIALRDECIRRAEQRILQLMQEQEDMRVQLGVLEAERKAEGQP